MSLRNVNYKQSLMISAAVCIFSASVGLCLDPRLQHSNTSKEKGERGHRLPLGWAKTFSGSDLTDGKVHLGIWVPSRYGGKLNVNILAGQATIGTIKYMKDQSTYQPDSEIGLDKNGYYEFDVVATGGFTITNTFVEEGCSDIIPWNFWYYPQSSLKRGPHLWSATDDSGTGLGPLKKFDRYFNEFIVPHQQAKSWSYECTFFSNSLDNVGGYCGAASKASVLIKQPRVEQLPGNQNPFSFTPEDLESYVTSYFFSMPAISPPDCPKPCIGSPYRELSNPGVMIEKRNAEKGQADWSVDRYVHCFHLELIKNLRASQIGIEDKKSYPFVLDLRTEGKSYNHACYKYKSVLWEDPDCPTPLSMDSVRMIRYRTTICCNWDDWKPGSQGNPETNPPPVTRTMEYRLMFGFDGEILRPANEDNPAVFRIGKYNQDWISCQDDESDEVMVPSEFARLRGVAAKYWNHNCPYAPHNDGVTFDRLNVLGYETN